MTNLHESINSVGSRGEREDPSISYKDNINSILKYEEAQRAVLEKRIQDLQFKYKKELNSKDEQEREAAAMRIAEEEASLKKELDDKINANRARAIKSLADLEKDEAVAKIKAEADAAKQKIKDSKKLHTYELEAQKELIQERTAAAVEELKAQEELNKANYESQQQLYKEKLLHATKLGEVMAANGKSYAENMSAAASKAINAIGKGVEKYMDIYANYMGVIDARLQDSGLNFSKLNKQLRQATAANPYVQYTKVLDKMSQLIDLGIADNVLQRAFLDEISNKIATTFDATTQSMLQIIRIQREDTTASRLGLEANLTRLFNYYFSDTSYLSTQFDAVQETLLGVSAQLSTQSSIEFEYIVQKWLGAAASVGVSNETISKIAQGLSYLGTGNVSALSSDTALQNLLVMAANKGGLNYSQMLTGGISAQQANQLLYSLIQYVQDIASNKNNVVKSQYSELFGVSLADMKAFTNLSKDMASLYSVGMTYSDTLNELNSQLNQVKKRTHLSEMINNLMENTLAGMGLGIADNAVAYGLYRAADMLESLTGGINLPYITAMGSGMDLNMSLEGLAKSGILGFGAVTQLISAINGLRAGGGLNLNNWKVESTKGQGFVGYRNAGSLLDTTSSTAFVQSTSGTGTSQSLVDQQKEAGTTVMGSEENQGDELLALVRLITEILGNEKSPINVKIDGISPGITIPTSEAIASL